MTRSSNSIKSELSFEDEDGLSSYDLALISSKNSERLEILCDTDDYDLLAA